MLRRMSGTRLSHRVILTAFPLLISALFGNFGIVDGRSSSESNEAPQKSDAGRSIEEKQYRAVPLLKYHSSEEYNPFDSIDILRYPNDRKRPSSATSTGSDTRGIYNQKFLNTKAVPFAVTKSSHESHGKNQPNPYHDCFFGKNCPENISLDKRISAPNNAFRHKFGSVFDEEQISFGEHKTQTSTIPFTVKAEQKLGSVDDPSLFSTSTRRTRTTTPIGDANWVKLQPLSPPKSYDPFSLSRNGSSSEEVNSTSLFASRSGVELNPESFAERHGWKDGKYAGPGGAKLPAWLEELNYQHGGYGSNRRQGYEPDRSNYDRDREDSTRWVKLEAIPVAGVKISKWVPKNTAPAELPSTSWKYPSKPSWWDRMDGPGNSYAHHQQHHHSPRPSMYPSSQQSSNPGWPTRYPSQQHQHHQTDSWGDVIYPNNNPISATASWASDNKASASMPIGVSMGWPKNSNQGARYPIASWSSSENNRPNHNSGQNNYQFSRPQGSLAVGKPPYYPDPDSKDEQQWVLISSTKNNQQAGHGNAHGQSPYGEFPYNFHNNRHSKFINLTKLDKFGSSAAVVPNRPMMTQDELFRRTNATLFSLKPVLGGKRGSYFTTQSPHLSQTLIDMLTSTAANIVESSTMKYNNIGMSRSTTVKRSITAAPTRKKRVMSEINPAYASVGAGMLPSTFGALIPMVFGGRKRRDLPNPRRIKHYYYASLAS